MRKRYISDEHGHWIPAEEYYAREAPAGPMVMPDIEPYQSMITGETITSRSRHRDHLREHGCIEIGNDTAPLLHHYDNIPDATAKSRHELIRAQVDAMSHKEFRAAIKRDADRVKWNSRED